MSNNNSNASVVCGIVEQAISQALRMQYNMLIEYPPNEAEETAFEKSTQWAYDRIAEQFPVEERDNG